MLSLRTIRGPATGSFQMPVWTVFPCQATSFGIPTLTDRSDAIHIPPHDGRWGPSRAAHSGITSKLATRHSAVSAMA
jgi:hypothetical protein